MNLKTKVLIRIIHFNICFLVKSDEQKFLLTQQPCNLLFQYQNDDIAVLMS